MKLFFTFAAIVGCTIGCGFSVCAATGEPAATKSRSPASPYAGSASERECRKLQCLSDITAARIESLNKSDEHEPFDFGNELAKSPTTNRLRPGMK